MTLVCWLFTNGNNDTSLIGSVANLILYHGNGGKHTYFRHPANDGHLLTKQWTEDTEQVLMPNNIQLSGGNSYHLHQQKRDESLLMLITMRL